MRCRSAAVIHLVFDRVRRVFVGVDLFPLQRHVAVQLILGEHVTGQQEVMVFFQFFQGFTQRAADRGDGGQFLGRQIVEILVRSRARVDLEKDSKRLRTAYSITQNQLIS